MSYSLRTHTHTRALAEIGVADRLLHARAAHTTSIPNSDSKTRTIKKDYYLRTFLRQHRQAANIMTDEMLSTNETMNVK